MASSTAALPLNSCIGLNGSVDGGLVLTRDGASIIYPLGSTIVVKSLQNEQEQSFLQGHTDQVCCCTCSVVLLIGLSTTEYLHCP